MEVSGAGDRRIVRTTEYIDGKKVIIEDGFRVYETIEESVEDYLNLIGRLDRYKIVRESSNYKEACKNILKAGYATDPDYSSKLIRIIEDNELYKYDLINDEV